MGWEARVPQPERSERPLPTTGESWERRSGDHVEASPLVAKCGCSWLRPVLEDLALYGMPSRTVLACIDCGRIWEKGT